MTASPTLGLSPTDRVMILAPHPDDEALGTGGLIQQALAAGASVRVVFVTDGDNNPWPQRHAERRLIIRPADRRRLGAQRRAEAVHALATLGLGGGDTFFQGFPDTALLPLWKKRDAAALAAFSRALADWPPTLLVTPSAHDRHPDHCGVFALAQAALGRNGQSPAQVSYLIHRPWFRRAPVLDVALPLTSAQRETKLRAILCHETQMKLSRRRFTSFAKPVEMFASVPPSAAGRA